MEIIKELFVKWDLGSWANVLQVVSFIFAMGAFFVGLFVKSEINRLKIGYVFDKRIKSHIENLKQSASELNKLLNNYDNNRHSIRTEFGKCIAELDDLAPKVSFRQGSKSRRLSSFLKRRRRRPFVIRQLQQSPLMFFVFKYPNRVFKTTYDDVWVVYDRLIEIIRQMENIVQNKKKSL